MSAADMPAYEWADLAWSKIERQVYKLQKRIYRAACRGDVALVHSLQRLLMKSWSAKCLATRKVTQDNRGKKTAGVDGVKDITPEHRLLLATTLTPDATPKPLRRVWIPKPGTTEERRPLGIPVLGDRAAQALVKLALEPEWEAHFEPQSYGFRPGRSCHDAVEAIFTAISTRAKYVLDADIAKCFDRINHQALVDKLQTFPTMQRAIKGWLKAGVMEGLDFTPTDAGTPQGGVVSPLLANIALHGLASFIIDHFPSSRMVEGKRTVWKPQVIRYADDFVILHHDKDAIVACQQLAVEWLGRLGLELKPAKTRIGHTLESIDGQAGFDFLGFTIRQYPVSMRQSAKATTGRRLGFKTFITPSGEGQRRHQEKLRAVVRRQRTARQADLIEALNPVITGWANYYRTVVSTRVFSRMDNLTFAKLLHWAMHRHPKKSRAWVAEKYWHIDSDGHWTFRDVHGLRLHKHAATKIVRHEKVAGAKSFFDGDWAYWATRLGKHPELPRRVAALLKQQRGYCAWCGLRFSMEDVYEIDHILPLSQGGQDSPHNRQLLHGHCHDAKTATDRSGAAHEVPLTPAR